MAQHYDVSLKALFAREGDGIIRRLLFGGRIAEYLPTEQPRVLNRRADFVARTENGALHHLEFQTSHEADFTFRMLEYYAYFLHKYRQHVNQVVLYLGPRPLRLERAIKTPSMDFQFEVINLRECEAGPLVASQDWADNVLAILAKGDPEETLRAVLPRLRKMNRDDRESAAGTLLLLSGIIGFEGTVRERLKEAGMIDVMENKVLGPMLRQQFAEGEKSLLRMLLKEKFGSLPEWAEKRMETASAAEMETWAKRVLTAATFEETLRDWPSQGG